MIKEITEADKIIDEMNNVTYDRVEMLRTKLEKCTSSVSDVSVQSSHKTHSREDALLLLAEMSSILDDSTQKLKKIYKNIDNRDLKIYFDKVYFKLSNAQLELKWGIGKRQINKICKKNRKNEIEFPLSSHLYTKI